MLRTAFFALGLADLTIARIAGNFVRFGMCGSELGSEQTVLATEVGPDAASVMIPGRQYCRSRPTLQTRSRAEPHPPAREPFFSEHLR